MATNQPWGTIVKPPFELGYQKLGADEVEDISTRLYNARPKTANKSVNRQVMIEKRKLDKEGITEMVNRLSNKEITVSQTPDANRTGLHKEEWGNVVNSYAWNGKNFQAILCGEESP